MEDVMDGIINDLELSDTKSKASALNGLLGELKKNVDLRQLEVNIRIYVW